MAQDIFALQAPRFSAKGVKWEIELTQRKEVMTKEEFTPNRKEVKEK
jgi:hypothetical protein